jgi:hypothetical protein
MTKTCSKCKLNFNIDNFNVKKRIKDKIIYQPYCKLCNKVYQKEHYINNKKSYISRNKNFKKANQDNMINFLQDKSCLDCGNKDSRVLEFDHLSDKSKNISETLNNWSWERILTEIAKCDIVCCNCHRLRTLKRSGSYRYN